MNHGHADSPGRGAGRRGGLLDGREHIRCRYGGVRHRAVHTVVPRGGARHGVDCTLSPMAKPALMA